MDATWPIISLGVVAVGAALVLVIGITFVIRDTVRKRGRWGINFRPVVCPNCGELAQFVRRPQNRRQAFWGGYTCAHCGTECDK